jgi:hypothetical protein
MITGNMPMLPIVLTVTIMHTNTCKCIAYCLELRGKSGIGSTRTCRSRAASRDFPG